MHRLRPLRLSPELRLVFRAADPSVPTAEMQALAQDVRDWHRVAALAGRENAVAPLWAVLRTHPSILSEEVSAFFRTGAMLSDFRMRRLSQRLAETVTELRVRGIPVMLLKGAAVGALTDPTFCARPMTDVDLLVRPDDLSGARAAVEVAGWHLGADAAHRRHLEDHHHDAPYYDATLPGLRLELHHDLLPPAVGFPFANDDLWRHAVSVGPPFEGAVVLSPAHLLCHVAVHFAWQHRMEFGAWRTLRAVGAVLHAPHFDWNEMLQMSRRLRTDSSVYWTLRLARRIGGFHVPDDVLARCAPPTPEMVRATAERAFISIFAPEDVPPVPSVKVSRLLWRAALRPSWTGVRDHVDQTHDEEIRRLRGDVPNLSVWHKVQRHLGNIPSWWTFVRRTLLSP